MKRLVGSLVAGMLGAGLAMSPALAVEAPHPSAAVRAFLASLALPDAPPAPEAAAGRPGVVGKALCSATANCGSSSPVSCSSTVNGATCVGTDQNCAAGVRGGVTCNGVTTQCPACPVNCPALQQQCADNCGSCPIRVFQCSPYRCTCDTSQGPCT